MNSFGVVYTDCTGDETVATKVDTEMKEYVQREAASMGVSTSEFLRLLIVAYRESE